MVDLIGRGLLRAFEDACARFGTLRTIEHAFDDEHLDVADADDHGTRRGSGRGVTAPAAWGRGQVH